MSGVSVMRIDQIRVMLSCLGGGLALAVAHSWFTAWPLALIALCPLIIAAARCSGRAAFFWGVLTFLPIVIVGSNCLRDVGDPRGIIVMAAGYGTVYLVTGGLTGVVLHAALRGPRWLLALAPLAICGLETMRAWLYVLTPLLGPYFDLGLTQVSAANPLLQLAEIVGVAGLSGVVVAINLMICSGLLGYPRRRALPVFVTIVVGMVATATLAVHDRHAAIAGGCKVGVVQAGVRNNDYRIRTFATFSPIAVRLEDLTTLARAGGADLVVWPEMAVPFSVMTYQPARDWLSGLVQRLDVSLLTGGLHAAESTASLWTVANAAVLFRPGIARPTARAKVLDAPLEGGLRWLHGEGYRERMRWLRGELDPPLTLALGDTPAACPICFEALFPAPLARAVREGAELFVVIGNDARFAHGRGAFFSLRHMMGRSVEFRRWTVRSANYGFTGFVSPAGEIRGEWSRVDGCAVVGTVHLREDVTAYARFRGAWEVVFVCSLGVILVSGFVNWLLTTRHQRRVSDAPAGTLDFIYQTETVP